MSLIKAENIKKDYQVGELIITALDRVSFEIAPASFVSFVAHPGVERPRSLTLSGVLINQQKERSRSLALM